MRTQGEWRKALSHNKVDYHIVTGNEPVNLKIIAQHVFKDEAEYICKAVNSHEKLKGMVEDLISCASNDSISNHIVKIAKNILKEIEGQ